MDEWAKFEAREWTKTTVETAWSLQDRAAAVRRVSHVLRDHNIALREETRLILEEMARPAPGSPVEAPEPDAAVR